MPKRALELWTKFKLFRISASVDAIDSVNNYIRHPSNFSIVEKNLKLLDDTPDNIAVSVSTTIQALNIFYFPDLLRWLLNSGFRKVNIRGPAVDPCFFVHAHVLHRPEYLSVKILPPELKISIQEKFASFSIWLDSHLSDRSISPEQARRWKESILSSLNGYLRFMNERDETQRLPLFWKEMRDSDQFRSEDIRLVLPEIAGPILGWLKNNHENYN